MGIPRSLLTRAVLTRRTMVAAKRSFVVFHWFGACRTVVAC
jgi:hypothetical protein